MRWLTGNVTDTGDLVAAGEWLYFSDAEAVSAFRNQFTSFLAAAARPYAFWSAAIKKVSVAIKVVVAIEVIVVGKAATVFRKNAFL